MGKGLGLGCLRIAGIDRGLRVEPGFGEMLETTRSSLWMS